MAKNSSKIESRVESRENNQTPRPVYFLSVTVENIRCFGPRQTLDLSNGQGRPSQWTIILGNNGVGKTTLLQSVVALTPARRAYRERDDGSGDVYPRLFIDARMELDWEYSRQRDGEHYLSANLLAGAKLLEAKGGDRVENFYVTGSRLDWGQSRSVSEAQLGGIACFAYGASRRMGETSLSDKSEDDPYASLFSDSAALVNAEEWLLQADYAARAADKSSSARRLAEKRRDDIKRVLIDILPEVGDIKFIQLTKEQLKPGIEVKTPYGWVSLKNLSLGYRTLTAWMVDLASRLFDKYPDSPNPLAEPAVVLVDEIDLHLHPKWQRNLMGFLTELFPNTQFIATAHSPLVVQAASDANVVLLKREGDHVVIVNDVKAIHGWRVDQILTSDLFGLESARPPQLDKLLAERTELLSKARLTKKDRERLEKIDEEVGALPTGETPEDMEAMDVIRRAAERLKAEGY